MAGYPDEFEGFAVQDQKNWSTFQKIQYKPKPFEDFDIDVKIIATSVCGSDVHTITGGWGDASTLPLVVGHEIVGEAVRVGSKVTTVKKGQRIGVGAQIWACLKCRQCKSDNENYCASQVDTYNAPYPEGPSKGFISQGGYASHIRAHEYFTFPIPDNIETNHAAPMMCAGLTVWSPLRRAGTGPGKKVAIVGLGGLGHFATMYSVALGAETYVISHTKEKEQDAKKLGAKGFIYSGDKDWSEPYKFFFDFVLVCSDMAHKLAMDEFQSILWVNCRLNHVGLPDESFQFMPQHMAPNGSAMSTTHIGSRVEMLDMLKLASEKNIKPWIDTIQISEAGCKEAVEKVNKNDVRYRYVLVGFDKAFGS